MLTILIPDLRAAYPRTAQKQALAFSSARQIVSKWADKPLEGLADTSRLTSRRLTQMRLT